MARRVVWEVDVKLAIARPTGTLVKATRLDTFDHR